MTHDMWGGPAPAARRRAPDSDVPSVAGPWPDEEPGEPPTAPDASRSARPARSPLAVSGPARLAYHATSTPATVSMASILIAVVLVTAWAFRGPLGEAWHRAVTSTTPAPQQTVTASPSPSPTVDPQEALAIAMLRATVPEMIGDAEVLHQSSTGKAAETSLRALAVATNLARTAYLTEAGLEDLQDAVEGLQAEMDAVRAEVSEYEKAEADRIAAEQQAQQPHGAGSKGSGGGSGQPSGGGGAQPGSSTATYSLTVTCNQETTVTLHATGGGTVTITANGQSATGAGSASLPVVATQVSAKATATGSVSMSYTWSGGGSTSCSG